MWSQQHIKFIITGFEPFGEHDTNPSSTMAYAIANKLTEEGIRAKAQTLPVTFACARTYATTLFEEDPDTQWVFLHCGLAANRRHINFEQIAHNIFGALEDNDGLLHDEAREVGVLRVGGPAKLTTKLPLIRLMQNLARQGHESVISQNAGTYVCNAIYYQTLYAVLQKRLQGASAEALFIHIPFYEEEEAQDAGLALAEVFAAWFF